MAELFGRDVKTVGNHINNALKEQLEGDREVKKDVEHYNLDLILSVGYRVKSKRGIATFCD